MINKLEKLNIINSFDNRIIIVFMIRSGGAALSLVISVVITRILGAAEYGIVAYGLSWMAILSIPAILGTDSIIVREVSILKEKHELNKIVGLLILSVKIVFLSSIIVFAVSMMFFWRLGERHLVLPMLISLLMLPFVSINSNLQAMFRGYNLIMRSQVPETLLKPVLLILIICISVLSGLHFTHMQVLLLYLLTTVITGLVFFIMIILIFPSVKPIKPTRQDLKALMKSVLPFSLISATSIINNRADVVMIGIIDSTTSSGIYNIATNGADLISFMLIAVNTVLAPTIAKLYNKKELFDLETILRNASKITIVATIPIFFIFLFAGKWILSFFGPQFTDGQYALILLCLGQAVNAGTGSIAVFLNMSGHEKITAIGFGLSAIGNILLNLLLIPRFGINGAAFATFASTSAWNILLLKKVIGRFNINPSIAGRRCQLHKT